MDENDNIIPENIQNTNLFQQVIDLLQNAREQVLHTVNSTMTHTYFEIGRMIVEEEQSGKERAEYGKQILKGLSGQLTKEFGKGFSVDNLQNMRRLYLIYSNYETLSSISENENIISETLSSISSKNESTLVTLNFMLTWSHYIYLMNIESCLINICF